MREAYFLAHVSQARGFPSAKVVAQPTRRASDLNRMLDDLCPAPIEPPIAVRQ
jgi:hypothetical protein